MARGRHVAGRARDGGATRTCAARETAPGRVRRRYWRAQLTAAQIVAATGHKLNGVTKHLHLLLQAGIIQSRPAADRRVIEYYLPAKFRPEAGKLDFGIISVQVNG